MERRSAVNEVMIAVSLVNVEWSEEVVVIPTLSKPSGSDFQKWSRSSDAKRYDVGKYYY